MLAWTNTSSGQSRLRMLQGMALVQAALAVQARVVTYGWLLGEVGAGALPRVYLLQSIPLVLLSVVLMGMVDRVGRARFLSAVCLLFGAVVGLTVLGSSLGISGLSPLFLLASETALSTLSALFWLLMSELLSPEEARQQVTAIGASSAVGAILGGGFASLMSGAPHALAISSMLVPILALAGISSLAHRRFAYRVGPRGLKREERWEGQLKEVKALVNGSSLLRWMAMLTGLITAAGLITDYAFSRTLEQQYSSTQLSFILSSVHVGINVLQLGLALGFNRHLFSMLGLTRTFVVFPLGGGLLLTLGILVAPAWPIIALKVFDRLQNYLVLNPGVGIMLTALPRGQRGRASLVYSGLIKPLAVALTGALLSLTWPGSSLYLVLAVVFFLIGAVLWRLREVYLETLLGNLHSAEPALVESSIEALGSPEFRRASPQVLHFIGSLEDPHLLEHALLAAGRLQDTCFLPLLLEALKGDNLSLKVAAVRGLVHHPLPEVRDALLGQLQLEDSSWVKARILGALAHAGLEQELRTVLWAGLVDPDPRVRANAVETLGMSGVAEDLERLIPLLSDPAPRVWANAVVALAQAPALRPRALEVLLERSLDADGVTLRSALYAAGRAQARELEPFVWRAVEQGEPNLRRQALVALACWGEVGVVDALIELLSAGNEQARLLARALPRIPEPIMERLMAQVLLAPGDARGRVLVTLRTCGVHWHELVDRLEALAEVPAHPPEEDVTGARKAAL